ncbi:MAG: cytochrome ubiquinol oxidase subunit I [Planctomycetota bacterium]|nr:cytochrome ubiquinol oxidase subunit I [Planctomycetota bacterium]MCX8040773.1 cytochrome ubiquinol oxidase subunit I [Planctomycetota bacterium]MDW8372151.1 cytochrome ubiquinol oxidase subunit I [Planctomycetota bacterium]
MDDYLLSRLQFAANVSFHILFPTITIALGWILVFLKWRYTRSGEEHWMDLYFFFTKVFALAFSLGVVSGLTMSFQFGTNWPGFMNTVGNVAGPLLAYEVLTAFFLEATFLGIMLFAFKKVPNWVHTLATVLVAFGTTLSAFWILVLNSWMHTPQGFTMIDGKAHATDWLAIVFSPSMPYRFAHTLLSSVLTAGFLMAGMLAWRWFAGDRGAAVQAGLRTAVLLLAVAAPLQLVVGDLHGINTRDYQPAKLAAMEAQWRTESGAPLVLFAIPDEEERRNRAELAIPKLGSLVITRDPNGTVRGLDQFVGEHPPVAPVFWSFRLMVGIGLLMIAVAWLGAWLLWRRRAWPDWYLRTLSWMTFSGWIASLAGWYVTEIGRQPWLVQGVLKTREAVATHPPAMVGFTFVLYLITYLVLVAAFIAVLAYLARKAAQAAQPAVAETSP